MTDRDPARKALDIDGLVKRNRHEAFNEYMDRDQFGALLVENADAIDALLDEIVSLRAEIAETRETVRSKPVDEALEHLSARFAVAAHFVTPTDRLAALQEELRDAALATYTRLAMPYLNRAVAAELALAKAREDALEEAANDTAHSDESKTAPEGVDLTAWHDGYEAGWRARGNAVRALKPIVAGMKEKGDV